MTELTEPVQPELSDPAPLGVLAGDHRDDDGTWIDEAFEPNPGGPESRAGVPYEAPTLKPTTRILSREVQIGTRDGVLYDPVMAFPSDRNRKTLIIETDGPISVTSDKTDANGAAILSGSFPFTSDTHTGAVWVHSLAATVVNVSLWIVTE